MTNVWVLDHKKKVIKIDHKLNAFGITVAAPAMEKPFSIWMIKSMAPMIYKTLFTAKSTYKV